MYIFIRPFASVHVRKPRLVLVVGTATATIFADSAPGMRKHNQTRRTLI